MLSCALTHRNRRFQETFLSHRRWALGCAHICVPHDSQCLALHLLFVLFFEWLTRTRMLGPLGFPLPQSIAWNRHVRSCCLSGRNVLLLFGANHGFHARHIGNIPIIRARFQTGGQLLFSQRGHFPRPSVACCAHSCIMWHYREQELATFDS